MFFNWTFHARNYYRSVADSFVMGHVGKPRYHESVSIYCGKLTTDFSTVTNPQKAGVAVTGFSQIVSLLDASIDARPTCTRINGAPGTYMVRNEL